MGDLLRAQRLRLRLGPDERALTPPLGGFLHFLRPGTTKLSLFPRAPLVGGIRRTWLDVALYAANQLFLLRALLIFAFAYDFLIGTPLSVSFAGVGAVVLQVSRASLYSRRGTPSRPGAMEAPSS